MNKSKLLATAFAVAALSFTTVYADDAKGKMDEKDMVKCMVDKDGKMMEHMVSKDECEKMGGKMHE